MISAGPSPSHRTTLWGWTWNWRHTGGRGVAVWRGLSTNACCGSRKCRPAAAVEVGTKADYRPQCQSKFTPNWRPLTVTHVGPFKFCIFLFKCSVLLTYWEHKRKKNIKGINILLLGRKNKHTGIIIWQILFPKYRSY